MKLKQLRLRTLLVTMAFAALGLAWLRYEIAGQGTLSPDFNTGSSPEIVFTCPTPDDCEKLKEGEAMQWLRDEVQRQLAACGNEDVDYTLTEIHLAGTDRFIVKYDCSRAARHYFDVRTLRYEEDAHDPGAVAKNARTEQAIKTAAEGFAKRYCLTVQTRD